METSICPQNRSVVSVYTHLTHSLTKAVPNHRQDIGRTLVSNQSIVYWRRRNAPQKVLYLYWFIGKIFSKWIRNVLLEDVMTVPLSKAQHLFHTHSRRRWQCRKQIPVSQNYKTTNSFLPFDVQMILTCGEKSPCWHESWRKDFPSWLWNGFA